MSPQIQILIDNEQSWIIPFVQKFIDKLKSKDFNVKLIFDHNAVVNGDILCLLGCEKKFKYLNLNKYNLVIHESDLPLGRGMSPFTWQIIEGKSKITISLLEATEEIDAGVIYEKIEVNLTGTELVNEWRILQANATFSLIENFLIKYPNVSGEVQVGEPTYYRRRTIIDSKLDLNKSILEQFNLLRVVDNHRYPAWFEVNGHKYYIKISRI